MAEARTAFDSSDFSRGRAAAEKALSFRNSDSGAWNLLARSLLAAGLDSEALAAWDKALANGSVEIPVCRASGLHCDPGRIEISKAAVTAFDSKGQKVFEAAPKDLNFEAPKIVKVALTPYSVARLRIEVSGKKHGFDFMPEGISDCKRGSYYLCGGRGPTVQKAVGDYIAAKVAETARRGR